METGLYHFIITVTVLKAPIVPARMFLLYSFPKTVIGTSIQLPYDVRIRTSALQARIVTVTTTDSGSTDWIIA